MYLWLKAFHVIAVIAWMAGLLYLPRLFVYHADVAVGSATSETFKVMEGRLLRIIVTPAMIVTWLLGLILAYEGDLFRAPWLHGKLLLVIMLSGFTGFLSRCTRDFRADRNTRSSKFYRMLNEVATGMMVLIVILAIVKPWG
jgi:putative membrane protein